MQENIKDDTISRRAAFDAINHELRCGAVIDQCGLETAYDLIEELPAAQPDNDVIHLQKEQAYMQGWEEGREALRKEMWEDGRDRLD